MGWSFLPSLRDKSTPARRGETKVVGTNIHEVLSAAGAMAPYEMRPWPIDRAVCEALERTVWVFKSVMAISGNGARLKYRVKQGEDILTDHPMMRLLNKQANPLETGPQFRRRLGAQVLLSKRGAFVEVTTARNGTPMRLDLLPPGRTRPVPVREYQLQDIQDLSSLKSIIEYFEVERSAGSPRRISPDKVRWIRNPHPTNPFLSLTPLEAAGMSVQLDVMSRLYNIRSLQNDGRPGGIVAIDGDMEDDDMDELERRFGPGPLNAGKTSVVTGKVTYADLGAKPRDMAHETTARTAKEEILTTFGVGESVIGQASGRTFDNAEQEFFNFWTVTMPDFLDMMTTAFDGDSEDELEGFFDTDDIEVLQKVKARVREEARAEVDAGLRSLDEYREVAGLPRLDTPQSRALWMASGKTPIPATEEDAAAFGLSPAGQEEAPEEEAPVDGEPGAAEQAPAQQGEPAPAGQVEASQEDLLAGVKQLPLPPPPPDDDGDQDEDATSEPDPAVAARLEEALAAALAAKAAELLARTVARLGSPKARKGTRHWQVKAATGEDTRAGQQALDASQVVDANRWGQDAQMVAAPIVTAAAVTAAAAVLADLGGSVPANLGAVVAAPVAEVLALIGVSATAQAVRLANLIGDLDQDGLDGVEVDLQVVIDAAGGQSERLATWAALLAVQAATATLNGARDAAVIHITAEDPHADIVRIWRTRPDDRVRPTHRSASGQRQGLQSLFAVGSSLLRYPGDPLGPLREVAGCRCWLIHQRRSTGRFVAAPQGTQTRRAG